MTRTPTEIDQLLFVLRRALASVAPLEEGLATAAAALDRGDVPVALARVTAALDGIRRAVADAPPPEAGDLVQIRPHGSPLDGCIGIVREAGAEPVGPVGPDGVLVAITYPGEQGAMRAVAVLERDLVVVVGRAAYTPQGSVSPPRRVTWPARDDREIPGDAPQDRRHRFLAAVATFVNAHEGDLPVSGLRDLARDMRRGVASPESWVEDVATAVVLHLAHRVDTGGVTDVRRVAAILDRVPDGATPADVLAVRAIEYLGYDRAQNAYAAGLAAIARGLR